MASERLQVILQLVAGQYKSEARQAASATSEVVRQAQSAGGSIGQLDAGLRAVAQKMGLTEAEARDLATQMSRGVKESNQLYGELVALGKQMGLTDREARQFARSMQRSTTEVDKAGGIFKRVKGEIAGLGTTAKVALGTVLAQAVGNFFRGAAQAATDLNESGNAIRVVFGEAASTIEAFGQVSAQATGLATSTFQQMAAQTG